MGLHLVPPPEEEPVAAPRDPETEEGHSPTHPAGKSLHEPPTGPEEPPWLSATPQVPTLEGIAWVMTRLADPDLFDRVLDDIETWTGRTDPQVAMAVLGAVATHVIEQSLVVPDPS